MFDHIAFGIGCFIILFIILHLIYMSISTLKILNGKYVEYKCFLLDINPSNPYLDKLPFKMVKRKVRNNKIQCWVNIVVSIFTLLTLMALIYTRIFG